jgi:uncharacterized protein YggE
MASHRHPLFLTHLAFAALAMGFAAPAEAQPAAAEQRIITVSGEGEIKAVPDEAILSAGVVSQAATAEEALAANRRAMNDVFATLKQQGILDRAIRTSEFNVSPQYEAERKDGAPPHIVAYRVSNSVSVAVDDLSKLGSAIDALVASGANSMGGISFTIRDPKPLLGQARDAAVKDAMDRAETYAKAAGLTLGHVVQINEGGMESPRPVFRAMAFDAAPAPTPIAAGEQTVSAQVTMTFEIK